MDTLSYKTQTAKDEHITKEWHVIDATDIVLGRMSTQIAVLLRGKHKPYYSPHVDCGDNVIVINAEKVKMTGNKWTDKQYIRHTGYPGGQRSVTSKEMLAKHPNRIIEIAVKGMLPKNRLGRALFRKLHVYAGPDHPHQAQKPTAYKIG